MRIKYDLSLRFADVDINEVIIDQYYSYKHYDVSDWIILELIKNLHNRKSSNKTENERFEYYVEEPVFHNDKPYRLILVMEKGFNYIGVINAFRVKEKK